jgi:hypothetical protein
MMEGRKINGDRLGQAEIKRVEGGVSAHENVFWIRIDLEIFVGA